MCLVANAYRQKMNESSASNNFSKDDLEQELENLATGMDLDYEDDVQFRESLTKYSISTYGSDLEVEVLVKRLNEDRYVIPDYQRGYVWTRRRASKFIESLLVGLPIPGIFLYREGEKFLVIDGHQRLRSLQAFLSGRFPESDKIFKLEGVSAEFNGKTYPELSATDKSNLDTAIIHASIIEQEQPSETGNASSIYHIFERINSGSVPLTPHEVRYCANYGEFARQIKEWNKDSNWRELIGKVNARMKDQEIILRFVALLSNRTSYEAPMQSFLDGYLRKNRDPDKDFLRETEEIFKQTVAYINSHVGDKAFRRSTAINVAIADAILVTTADGLKAQDLKQNYNEQVTQLKLDPEFIEVTGSSTSDKEKVKKRMERAKVFLRQ